MEKHNFFIGQKVTLVTETSTTETSVEVGVIVWIWEDEEYGFPDAYVALFGESFPENQPTKMPGIYRYALASLRPYEQT